MGKLYEKLTEYGKSDYYPYHMPGHKRNMSGRPFKELYGLDITEIDGFDNLHQAEGILLDVEKRTNQMYGAEETFLLVNGSTCGILSAVSATVKTGGKILIARNCHKSVYQGAYLRNLQVQYIYPKILEKFGVALGVSSKDVEEKLRADREIEAVVITSPTYEGIISDIEKIAQIVHSYHVPLIVDEAHGAHLGFSQEFPRNAIGAGADIVIHSLHKTLPSPTQTALLHVSGKLINREKLKRYLGIYQSSSPSYPLMAGMELCLDIVEEEGKALFSRLHENWEKMLSTLGQCKALKILCKEDVLEAGMKDFDVGKLVISTKGTYWSGQQLYEVLLNRYHLQMEMAADNFVLAMFTIMDREEGFERLTKALMELDKEIYKECAGKSDEIELNRDSAIGLSEENVGKTVAENAERGGNTELEAGCRIMEALDAEIALLSLKECEGRTAAGFVNLYPPGIPVVVPGEIYNRQIISNIENWHRKNLNVQGVNHDMEVPVIEE